MNLSWLVAGGWLGMLAYIAVQRIKAPLLDESWEPDMEVKFTKIPQQTVGYSPKALAKGKWMDSATGVCMRCPRCGETIWLVPAAADPDYEVGEGGVVRPIVVCSNLKCSFEEHVILDGYFPYD